MLLFTVAENPLLPGCLTHDELADLRDLAPKTVYRWAICHGFTVDEAGDWVAWCSGIDLADTDEIPRAGWTLRAVGHVLFLRYLIDTGQLGGPPDRPRSTATSPTAPGSSPVHGPKE